MDKLIEFACDELEELERKAEKEGSLTKSDFEYAKDLASFKKDLMKSEKLSEEGYSNAYGRRYAPTALSPTIRAAAVQPRMAAPP